MNVDNLTVMKRAELYGEHCKREQVSRLNEKKKKVNLLNYSVVVQRMCWECDERVLNWEISTYWHWLAEAVSAKFVFRKKNLKNWFKFFFFSQRFICVRKPIQIKLWWLKKCENKLWLREIWLILFVLNDKWVKFENQLQSIFFSNQV